MMERIHTALHWAVVVSAGSHVFCCVLPTVISLLSVFAGLGMLPVFLPAFEAIHETLHGYELPMLLFSGSMLFLGWAAQVWSWRVDCHDTGCHHGPCQPKKRQASKILWLASGLFVLNMAVLFLAH